MRYARLLVAALVLVLVACDSPEEKAAKFLESGRTYYQAGEYVKANLELRNALQIDDSIVEAWFLLSKIAEKNANWRNTLRFSLKTVSLDPSHVAARLTLGKLYLAGKQLDKALEQSDALMKLAPGNARVHALRAAVLQRLSDLDGAVAEAAKALDIDPESVEGLIVLASARLAGGETSAALALYDKGLAAHPDNLALHVLKIKIFEDAGNYDAASAAYEAAIAARPDQIALRQAFAQLHLKHGAVDKAEKIYRDIVARDPKNVQTKLQFAEFLARARGPQAAIDVLTKFIKDDPSKVPLQFALAAAHIRAGARGEAAKIYRAVAVAHENGPDGLSAKNKLAALAIDGGDNAEGARLLQEVLGVDPRNEEALLIRGAARLKAFETEAAVADLRTVLRDDPNSAAALLMLARAHLQSGASDLANDYYVRAIAGNPERLDIRQEYARYLFRRGDFRRAEEVLLALLEFDPNSLPALRAMTQVKLARQDWAGAQDYARRVEKAAGDEAFLEQVSGVVYRAQEKVDLSIASFKRAHKLSPNAAQPVVSLVRTYLRYGKRKEAKNFLDRVVRAYQGNVMAHVLLGQIYAIEENWDAAEQAFRQAIAVGPKSPIGYRSLAALHVHGGDFDAAERDIADGLAAIPGNISLRLNLAGVNERRHDYDKAIKIYDDIIADNPGVDVAVNNLAALLSDHRTDQASLDRALKLAERFRDATFPYFRDTLGWVYYRRGEYDQALRLQKRVVEDLPEIPIFRYHLGMAYLAVGDRAHAKAELEKALSFGKTDAFEVAEVEAILEGLE